MELLHKTSWRGAGVTPAQKSKHHTCHLYASFKTPYDNQPHSGLSREYCFGFVASSSWGPFNLGARSCSKSHEIQIAH